MILIDKPIGIGPGLPTCLVLTQEYCQASREIAPISTGDEDRLPRDCMPEHMMQGPVGHLSCPFGAWGLFITSIKGVK
jgi:hypothetical protein